MSSELTNGQPARRPEKDGPELVTRWDLDKTYLRSDFYTLRDLLRNLSERPDQKRPVPGAARLLGELALENTYVHILSGSPEQMRDSLGERLHMDGVRFDELTLKPNLANLLRLRFRSLKGQLGYKLPALLLARKGEIARFGTAALPEILVGDDSEADAFVYSLYADIAAGHLELAQLRRVLEAGDLYEDDLARTLDLAASVRGTASPDQFTILLHLDRQSPPSVFAPYGTRLVPFFNYAQAALVLFDRGLLSARSTFLVAEDLLTEHRFDLAALSRSYWDLRRRGHVADTLLDRLRGGVDGEPLAAHGWPTAILQDSLDAQPATSPGETHPLDYVTLAREHRGGKNRR